MNPQELFDYGIIAAVDHPTEKDMLSILHFVGFAVEPGKAEYEHIYAELKTDPEFGLVDVDFDLYPAPQHVVDHFKNNTDFEVIPHDPSNPNEKSND